MRPSLSLLSALVLLSLSSRAFAQEDAPTAAPPPAETAQTDAPPPAPAPPAAVETQKAALVPTDEGWNKRWAILFSLNNVLSNANILTQPITGSIGGAYYLNDSSAIRGGITFARSKTPVQVTKTTVTTGEETITTYQVTNPSGQTEAYNLALRGDYLMRLMDTAIAPYAGGGASVGWTWTRTKFVDEVSVVDTRTATNNNASTFDLTGRGIAGAEWRVHPSFALFAEYQVNLTVFSKTRQNNASTVESTVGGTAATVETRSERDTTAWLTWNTGIAQTATLGLSVMF